MIKEKRTKEDGRFLYLYWSSEERQKEVEAQEADSPKQNDASKPASEPNSNKQ